MQRYGELIAISKELIIVSHQIAAGILQRIVFTNRVRQANYDLLFQLRIRENFKSEDFLRTRSYNESMRNISLSSLEFGC